MSGKTNNLKEQKGFEISIGPIKNKRTTFDALKKLPLSARPLVDATDVVVPEGYVVEPVMVGLSFPTDIAFADNGTIFVSEGGSSWPTRPYMPARVLMLQPDGELEAI